MAAVMSADMGDADKVVPLIEEARRMGLKVNPPDVNQGDLKFTVNAEGDVVYGPARCADWARDRFPPSSTLGHMAIY